MSKYEQLNRNARDEQVAKAERERIIRLLEGYKNRIHWEPGNMPSSVVFQFVALNDCVELIEGMATPTKREK
jgi:hypothetical protein